MFFLLRFVALADPADDAEIDRVIPAYPIT